MATENWGKFKSLLKETADISAKTTKSVLQEVSRKTKELTEIGKIKLEIVQLEKKKEKLVLSLGEVVLQKFKSGTQQSVTQSQVEVKEILLGIGEIERNISIKHAKLEKLNTTSNTTTATTNDAPAAPQTPPPTEKKTKEIADSSESPAKKTKAPTKKTTAKKSDS